MGANFRSYPMAKTANALQRGIASVSLFIKARLDKGPVLGKKFERFCNKPRFEHEALSNRQCFKKC